MGPSSIGLVHRNKLQHHIKEKQNTVLVEHEKVISVDAILNELK